MNSRLHYLKISNAFEGRPEPIDITYITRDGDVVSGRCFITSSHFKPASINVKFVDSGEVRKLRCIRIVRINQTEIFV